MVSNRRRHGDKNMLSEPRSKELLKALEEEVNAALKAGAKLEEVFIAVGALFEAVIRMMPSGSRARALRAARTQLFKIEQVQ